LRGMTGKQASKVKVGPFPMSVGDQNFTRFAILHFLLCFPKIIDVFFFQKF